MYTPQPHPKPGPVPELAPFRIDAESFAPAGLLLEVFGELDVETTPALRVQLSHALDRGVRRVVIDLSRLDFLDSIAVAALLQIRLRLADHGCLAVVVEPGSYARMVFEIAGLPRSLSVVATRGEALAAVGAA
jgi:anti-sigma B factor antagonist